MKDNYRNIQGRRAGKATRDLPVKKVDFSGRPYNFSLTNSERNLYVKVKEQIEREKTTRRTVTKRKEVTRIMRLMIIIRRLLRLR